MSTIAIHSSESLQRALGDIREAYADHHYLEIVIRGDKRSQSQNSIGHVWYEQVARELREDSPLGVKCFCKLHFGVPILRAEDAEYREVYDAVIKPMAYETKLKAMAAWAVTSRMNKAQKSQYLEAMQSHYHGRGVVLEFPESLERAA